MQNNENNLNQNIPESVWADGCPEVVKEEDKIPAQELLAMAINYVVENCVVPKGFKLEHGYPNLNFPNIIMKRDGVLYAVVVFPSIYPQYAIMQDKFRIDFVKQSKEKGITPLFAPVGYKSIDPERAKAGLTLRGDVFQTSFPGFIVLNDEEKFNYSVKPEDLFRP